MQRLLVEGIGSGGELSLMEIVKPEPTPESLSGFFEILTRHRINISLSIGRQTDSGSELLFCVAREAADRLQALALSELSLEGQKKTHADVEVLTLFPHAGSFKFIGLCLLAFAEGGIPLHGFCSSFSALTFITEAGHTEKALAALQPYLSLPAGPQDCP